MRLIDHQHSRALLVATAHYAQGTGLPDLDRVANGAIKLHDLLTAPEVGGFAEEHCLLMPDPVDPAEVGIELERLAGEATDTLLVYYAGHGLIGPRQQYYLGCAKTSEAKPHLRGLPAEWVLEAMRGSPAANRLLIVDSCFSGRILSASMMAAGPAAIVMPQLDLGDIEGKWTLTSSAKDLPSIAPEGAQFTAFTGALLDVLEYGAPHREALLTLDDIYIGVRTRLRNSGFPEPQVISTATASKLALVPNAAYDDAAPSWGTDELRLGTWWEDVTIRQAPVDAGKVRQWFGQQRMKGNYIGVTANPEIKNDVLSRPRVAHWMALYVKGMYFDKPDDMARALVNISAKNPTYAALALNGCPQVLEPVVAKSLDGLVDTNPDLVVTLLRGLLAELPGKCVRICHGMGLAVPPRQWYTDQQLEPPADG